MKKSILLALPLMLFALGFTSCSEDDLSEQSVIVTDSYEQNAFDKWLDLAKCRFSNKTSINMTDNFSFFTFSVNNSMPSVRTAWGR